MHVEKWYLDCVTADGAGVIYYAARIGVGPVAVRCSETLHWRAGDPAAVNRTVLGGQLPTATSAGIAWRSRALDAHGRWAPLGSGVPTTILHEEAAGRIEWTCFCPSGPAAVSIGGEPREGLGYVERLVITLPPARLPIRELRWGRFIAARHSCVWIRWRGPPERSWCFHNSRAVDAAMPELHQLSWGGYRLRLAPGATLRSGRIADTAFKHNGLLRRLVPAAVRDIAETKWCSRGVLTDVDGREHAGWAIHEVALWP